MMKLSIPDEAHRMALAATLYLPEAVVMYSGRILEHVFRDAMQVLGAEPKLNVYSNIERLKDWHGDGVPLRLAHALRGLANDVRHVRREVPVDESQFAAAFAWHVANWQEGWAGPIRAQAARDYSRAFHFIDGDVRAFVDALAVGSARGIPQLFNAAPARMRQPLLLQCLAIEQMIEARDLDGADALLGAASGRGESCLRLDQLRMLLLSRRAKDPQLSHAERLALVDEGLKLFAQLLARHGDEDETLGIGAGLHKFRWQTWSSMTAGAPRAETLAQADLEAMRRYYRRGWRNSQRSNAYLGINVAFAALMTGDLGEMQATAQEVQVLLDERRQRRQVLVLGTGAPHAATYWDMATDAEALLYLGRVAEADAAYAEAVRAFPREEGSHLIARRQRDTVVRALEGLRRPAA